jgi:hypothetical protein
MSSITIFFNVSSSNFQITLNLQEKFLITSELPQQIPLVIIQNLFTETIYD